MEHNLNWQMMRLLFIFLILSPSCICAIEKDNYMFLNNDEYPVYELKLSPFLWYHWQLDFDKKLVIAEVTFQRNEIEHEKGKQLNVTINYIITTFLINYLIIL